MNFLLPTILISGLVAGNPSSAKHPALQYTNHVFNGIHSAARQFGSSLNHNGMSLFVATVPKDTEFYHGTDNRYRINGTEWLAFEPEHALIFARGHRGSPPRTSPDEDGSRSLLRHVREKVANADSELANIRNAKRRSMSGDSPLLHYSESSNEASDEQYLGTDPTSAGSSDDQAGYLHTYRTKHELRLLYLDGQSAAKSDKGTLDVQDLVLLHDHPPVSDGPSQTRHERTPFWSFGKAQSANVPKPHGPLGEAERALGLCDLAQKDWQGRIDGILRMEAGFEIILCDFEKHLDILHIVQTAPAQGHAGPPGHQDPSDMLSYYKAVAASYNGISGGRVNLNYDDFISLLSYPDLVYFDGTGRPRVDNSSADAIASVRSDITNLVLQGRKAPSQNWRDVADMLVNRYADRIEVLATPGSFKTLGEFTAEINRALRPFIDYNDRNTDNEVHRCVHQHLPLHTNHSTAYYAISNVSTVLCQTLIAASQAYRLDHGVSLMQGLKSWLAWPTWKRCRGCAADQVCFLPIWPMGSARDFEQPRCVGSEHFDGSHGDYWKDMGPRPEPPL